MGGGSGAAAPVASFVVCMSLVFVVFCCIGEAAILVVAVVVVAIVVAIAVAV